MGHADRWELLALKPQDETFTGAYTSAEDESMRHAVHLLSSAQYQVKALSIVNSTSSAAKTAKNLPAFGVSSPHLLNLSSACASRHAPAAKTLTTVMLGELTASTARACLVQVAC